MSSIIEEKILQLRKTGKSYNQISRELKLSKSTISYWLSSNKESKAIKEKLTKQNLKTSKIRIRKLIETNRRKYKFIQEETRDKAEETFYKLLSNPLFIAGITIYWGEGDSKQKNPLRIANTDPRMIKIYVCFLKEVMKIKEENIKLALILYPDLDNEVCKNFWVKVTNLRKSNFIKTQYIKGRHPTKRLENGICLVVANGGNREKIKMLTWIDLLSKNL